MPARALPRARSGGVQNKCEVKKLAWLKTPNCRVSRFVRGEAAVPSYQQKSVKKWAFNGSLVNVRPKMLG